MRLPRPAKAGLAMTEGMLRALVMTMPLLLAMTGVVMAGKSQRGTSAANFLKIVPGARQAALGGASIALAEDAYTLHSNPSGAMLLPKGQFAASHVSYFQSMNFNYLSLVLPHQKGRALGFSISNLDIDGIEKRSGDQDNPEGTFSAGDNAYQASYAQDLPQLPFFEKRISLGLSMKYLSSHIDTTGANAWALDTGLLVHDVAPHIKRVGLAVRNIGTEMKFDQEGDPLPFTVGAGAKIEAAGRLSVLPEIAAPRDNEINGSLGLEYGIPVKENFSMMLRTGYTSNTSVKDGLQGLSAGLGFSLKTFSFDFGWVPYGELGNTFRYSLLARF